MAKHILITGSSSGIGAEAARQLAAGGNRIFVHYNRSKEQAESVARDVRERGGQAEMFQADLSTDSGCVKLAERVAERWDRLDVLINNAGALVERRPAREID